MEIAREFVKNQYQRQSVVDLTLYFDEDRWVVSVLNTKEKEFGGHAVLLIEGVRDGQLFVGRYDVFAVTVDEEGGLSSKAKFFSAINRKGYIANVRTEETQTYDRIACHLALVSRAEEIVPSDISKNEVILQKVQENGCITAYWVEGSRICQKPLSIDEIEHSEALKFPETEIGRTLIHPNDNELVVKQVTALCGYKHPDGAEFYSRCQSRSFTQSAEMVERMIESIKADQARTRSAHLGNGPYIGYQYLGSKEAHGLLTLFSESGGGINCAEWCLEKLKVAEINLKVKPTPTKVSGGSSCLIL